ncbi:hypothetical protein [Micromonospora sp. NPDC005299]|uniref:hypothetical protein n=1 Tax=Micromonospora sp. NPDC005299 TaxID=3364231 RepID=UPI0036AC3C5B
MSESFEGRKVVVVDGSNGIGLATAHQVVAGGGTAVITGRDQDAIVDVDGGIMAGRN